MKMKKTIPYLPVNNIDDAVKFYEAKLGFNCQHKDLSFGILYRDEVEIHLWAANDKGWKSLSPQVLTEPIKSGAESFLAGTASCRVEVEKIDELFIEYKKKGVLYNQETVIEETPWGTREFPSLDLHRNLITFYETVER
jgi:uncharacterized glyoxalase superfamily protein PhnB